MQDHGDKWLCPPRYERNYMRVDTTGHSGTTEQKRAFCFFFSLLRLTSDRYPTIRCRWPECASLLIACPGTNRCHPVTTPPPPPRLTHTPVSEPTDRAKSWHVSNSLGSASVQLGKLFHKRRKVGVLQPAQIQKNVLNEEHKYSKNNPAFQPITHLWGISV